MSYTEVLTILSSMGGVAKIARRGDAKIPVVKSLPAGVAGAVGAVVDTTTVIDGLPTGHGITDADTVGAFWSGGLRVGMTVTAYDTNSITVTTASGTGDSLPAEDTAVVVSVRTLEDSVGFDGTDAQILSVMASKRAAVELMDSGGSSILAAPIEIPAPGALQDSGEGYVWASGLGVDNPMTDVAATIECYNGSTDAATVTFGVLLT